MARGSTRCKSVHGDTVVGPFEQDRLRSRLEITVDKPARRRPVTEDRLRRCNLTAKSAGVARVTITAPQTDSAQNGTEADGTRKMLATSSCNPGVVGPERLYLYWAAINSI